MIYKYLLAACLLIAQLTCAAELTGVIVGISDGDTLTVLVDKTPYTIRLAGIDAPESRQTFGQASKQHLSALAYKKAVTVLWDKKDRYGRIVGKVLVGGMDICLAQIKVGLAWHYTPARSPRPRRDSPAALRARWSRMLNMAVLSYSRWRGYQKQYNLVEL